MKLFFPLVVLLSLGTLVPAFGFEPFDDLTASSSTNLPDVQQHSSPVHRHLLQDSPGLVEVCNSRSGNRTLYWRRRELGFLFKITFPESCGSLTKADLVECTDDSNVKNGCCSKECIDVFRKITPECWKDLAAETCSRAMKSDVIKMDGLRRRCFPELGPFSCKECDLQSRGKPDRKKHDQLANLASIKMPKECGKFKALDLLACENNFNVAPGCCDDACHNLLRSMSDKCWVFLNVYACHHKPATKSVRLLNELSEKCEPVPRPVSCEGNDFKTDLLSVDIKVDRNGGRGKSKIALAASAIALTVVAYAL